jgi:catechol 2,3-dioxygenase-like lactoylglutathione lyase family enzyme
MRRVAARDLHHVGIAVADLDAAVERWRRLFGAEVEAEEEVDEVPRQGLYGPVAFVHPETVGGVLVELVGRQGPSIPKEAQ